MLEMLKNKIIKHKFENCITPEEIIDYLNAESYENDYYNLSSILKNDYLIFHELVEVCCLKKRGLKISKKVILENREVVYRCHLEALDMELEYARKNKNIKWIHRRTKDLESYLDDPYLPKSLRKKVLQLIEKWKV